MINNFESTNKITILKNKFKNLTDLIDNHIPFKLTETYFQPNGEFINSENFENNIKSIQFVENDNNVFFQLIFQYNKIKSEIITADFMLVRNGYKYFSDILNLDLSIEILNRFINAFNGNNNKSIDNFINNAFDIFINEKTKKLFDEFILLSNADREINEKNHTIELKYVVQKINNVTKKLNKLNKIIFKNGFNSELNDKKNDINFQLKLFKSHQKSLTKLIQDKYTKYNWDEFYGDYRIAFIK